MASYLGGHNALGDARGGSLETVTQRSGKEVLWGLGDSLGEGGSPGGGWRV